jgi:hypothetical protein
LSPETILYILVAAIVSIIVSVFMYGYKTKYRGKLRWLFGILRGITIFSILLLIINPKFKSETYTTYKPKLSVVLDNSFSINELNQTENVKYVKGLLAESSELSTKFDISYFQFGTSFKGEDSLSFDENNTNISSVFNSVAEIFDTEIAPTILVTDGNQTIGTDYEFATNQLKNPVYPIILGDSIKYKDLKIQQLNTNRYAFLKNRFPVEVVLVYSGTESVSSRFTITQGSAVF